MHQKAAAVFDTIFDRIAETRRLRVKKARRPAPLAHAHHAHAQRLDWTKFVDGKPVENTWRAHQVPLDQIREKPEHLAQLDEWMHSYKPEELFDDRGKLLDELRQSLKGRLRMGMTRMPTAACCFSRSRCPTSAISQSRFKALVKRMLNPRASWGTSSMASCRPTWILKTSASFGPDETASNRIDEVEVGPAKHGWPKLCRSTKNCRKPAT